MMDGLKFRKVLMAVVLLLGCVNAWAEAGKSQIPLADPYILLDGGKYYAYGTHDASGIRCYSSDDLRSWTDEGQALNKANTTEQQWFWAPEVYHVGDKYIMYFSANEHLFAATAISPTGPFKQVGTYQMNSLIGDEKCIDSSVFFDTDGKAYIFFVRFTDGNCIWQAQLSDDYITPVAGTLKKCFAASQTWELKLGKVNEGPNVLKVGKRYYLTYSGNDYRSQDYGVGYATSSSIGSGSWTKYGSNPILHMWDDLVGTGHHSLFYDKEGILRIVFHAHNSTTEVGTRLMYIGTMIATSTRLSMSNEPIIRPTLTTYPYNPELTTRTWGFEDGGAVTVDLNNSGYQDIVAGGISNEVQNSASEERTSKRMTYLQLYYGTLHKWAKCSYTPPFSVADKPSFCPCDINNDGNMDIIAFDATGTDVTAEAYTGGYSTEGVFLGQGNGSFSTADLHFTDQDGNTCPFDIKGPCSAEVTDIDNDGRLDIICAGHQGEDNYNVILHNMGTEEDGIRFCVEPYETDYHFATAIIKAGDLNNDGYQDFAISANVDDMDGQTRFTDVYLNDTLRHGHFIRQMLGEKGATIKRKSNGGLQLADINNDGWLDIILAGQGESSSGETGTRQRVYLNKKSAVPTFMITTCDLMSDIYNLNSNSQNAIGVIDWNGDGWYDAMLGGLKSTASTSTGQLYLNDGKGKLKRAAVIPGATSASIIFPDYNGDGRKDMLLNGVCTDANYLTDEQKGQNAILCYNLYSTPTRPSAPDSCVATVAGDEVRLSWRAPADAKAGFTYEVYIEDAEGNQLNSTPSFIGSTRDGIRKLNGMGRAGCLTSWIWHPAKAGTYTWGVQTVDANYTGSPFSTAGTFTITEDDLLTGIKPVSRTSADSRCYTLDGRQLTHPRRGLNVISGKVVLR